MKALEAEKGNIEIIRSFIAGSTGMELGADKDYLVHGRLSALMAECGLASFAELVQALKGDQNSRLYHEFIDRITTHETLFFRDESIFTALSTQIIPEWLSRKMEGPLRIWCAAAATGQEVYSLLMLIHSRLPHVFERLEVLATDISELSLARAKSGLFSAFEIKRGLPEEFLERYFRREGQEYRIKSELRAKVRFECHNLKDRPYTGNYDLIFCRNVLIYFGLDLRRSILEEFRRVLRSDGAVILGSAETVNGCISNYVMRTCGLARYYELNNSKVTLF